MKTKGTTNARARIETFILWVVFAFYLLFMLRLLILSRVSLADLANGLGTAEERSINLIPFGSIFEYLLGDADTVRRFAFSNVIGNILTFIPLGAYLPLLRRDGRIGVNLLVVLVATLTIEIVQGVFSIGTADIDDVILNCLGGLIGICGHRLLLLILRDSKRVRTTLAFLSLLGLPALLYYTFVIKLRL